ncbi:MAG: hypothetical protein AB4041_12070 [Microcystaceae cyanobacterium]
MATEQKKQENRAQLANLALLSVAAGAWDLLGNGVNAFSGPMGNQILKVMENDMGLEIAGEDPEAVLMEISRIFVDEYGIASEIEVNIKDDKHFEIKVHNCANRAFTDTLRSNGVEKPFICPIMNASSAALKRMGYQVHKDIEQWKDGKGSIISFEAI